MSQFFKIAIHDGSGSGNAIVIHDAVKADLDVMLEAVAQRRAYLETSWFGWKRAKLNFALTVAPLVLFAVFSSMLPDALKGYSLAGAALLSGTMMVAGMIQAKKATAEQLKILWGKNHRQGSKG